MCFQLKNAEVCAHWNQKRGPNSEVPLCDFSYFGWDYCWPLSSLISLETLSTLTNFPFSDPEAGYSEPANSLPFTAERYAEMSSHLVCLWDRQLGASHTERLTAGTWIQALPSHLTCPIAFVKLLIRHLYFLQLKFVSFFSFLGG